MNINKTILFCAIIGLNSYPMQQQQQQVQKPQEQQQHQKPPSKDTEEPTKPVDAQTAELDALMQGILNNIIQQYGSVDAFVKQKQKRKVLCPICHQESCSFSKQEEF